MSDSLREQMLKAGFKETTVKKPAVNKTKGKNAQSHARSQANKSKNAASNKGGKAAQNQPSSMELANIAKREAVAARKRVKGEIKAIIDECKVDNTKGEVAHSYLIGKRIKQMFISEEAKAKVVSGELVITRLNGSTFLVPADAGVRIKNLNSDWVVITPSSDGSDDIDDEYADFQVPDDLQW